MRIFGLTITRRDVEAELKHTKDLLASMDVEYACMENMKNDRIAELKRNVQYWKNRAFFSFWTLSCEPVRFHAS